MPKLQRLLARPRGAAITEKLLVILFASVLIGGALMIFGPMLAAKYAFVADMVGMEPEPVRTLADGRPVETEGTNAFWYVLFSCGVAVFFAALIAPMMFPRARRKRQEAILALVERFPALAPLIDPDMLAEDGMVQLRALAEEVNALNRHRAGALEIQPHDFGKMALPSEQTVDASFSEMPDLDDILAAADPNYRPPQQAPKKPARRARSGFVPIADQSEETQAAIPLSQRLKALRGDDGIPFDAVDPSHKPQMQPLHKPAPPRHRPPSRPLGLGVPADDSTTVDVGSPDEVFEDPSRLAAQILGGRPSGRARIEDTDDATIIRDSQPLKGIDDTGTDTDLVRPLDRGRIKSGPLASTMDTTTPDSLDATTQDYDTYE